MPTSSIADQNRNSLNGSNSGVSQTSFDCSFPLSSLALLPSTVLVADEAAEQSSCAHQSVKQSIALPLAGDNAHTSGEAKGHATWTRALTDYLSEGVITVDHLGCITYANLAAATIIGWSREELIEQNIYECLQLFSAEADLNPITRALASKTVEQVDNVFCYQRGGNIIPVILAIAPVTGFEWPTPGLKRPAQFVISLRDASAERQLAEQLRRAQQIESTGSCTASIAHHFDSILTVILGNAQCVRGMLMPETTLNQCLDDIDEATVQARDFTRQLHDCSREQTFAPRAISLNETLLKMKRMLQVLAGESIHVDLHLSSSSPEIFADVTQITMLVVNLAQNACDAMPEGGHLLIETSGPVFKNDSPTHRFYSGNFVRLTITDSGNGMNEEIVKRIFEPFFSTKGEGGGLGLTGVQSIVKRHRGLIDVKSKPEIGTTFTVLLPTAHSSSSSM